MPFEFIDTVGAPAYQKLVLAFCDILSQSFVVPENITKITEIWISGWERSTSGEHIAEVGLHSSQSAEAGNWDLFLGTYYGWENHIVISGLDISVTPGETLYLLCRYIGSAGTIFYNTCGDWEYPGGTCAQWETHPAWPCFQGTWYQKNSDFQFRMEGEGEQPPECSEYLDMWDCWNNGCYYWGGACHEDPPTSCSQCITDAECDYYDGTPPPTCYWWPDGTGCHDIPYTGCVDPIGAEGDAYCYPSYGQPPYELFRCIGGTWVSQGENHPDCGYQEPPECTEGDTKCVGDDLYKCINEEWVLFEENHPDCIGNGGIIDYMPYVLIVAGIAVGVAAIMIPSKGKKKNG